MVRLGIPLFASLLVCTALAGSLVVLAGVLFVYGVVAAAVDVSMNAEGVVVERAYARPLMSGFHGMWSVGLLAGAVVAIGAAALGVRPAAHFTFVAVSVVVASARLLAGLPRRDGHASGARCPA